MDKLEPAYLYFPAMEPPYAPTPPWRLPSDQAGPMPPVGPVGPPQKEGAVQATAVDARTGASRKRKKRRAVP